MNIVRINDMPYHVHTTGRSWLMKSWTILEKGGKTTSFGVVCPKCLQSIKEGEMETRKLNEMVNKIKHDSANQKGGVKKENV